MAMESTPSTRTQDKPATGTRRPSARAEPNRADTSETETYDESTSCPECDGRMVRDSDARYCEDCGCVEEAPNIDHGPEWRSYDNSDRTQRSRVGSPLTESRHDRGLSTDIDWRNKDARGNPISARQRAKMSRLRTWDKRLQTRNHRERNLRSGLTEIRRMSSALGLPKDVTETASVIFRRASEDGHLPGRSIEGVASASLYLAARMEDIPRTYAQMKNVARVDISRIKRTQRYLVHEMKLKIKPATPDVYLPQFASDLGLPQEHVREANRLIDAVDGTTLSGNKPTGLAASALFAAGLTTGKLVTQKAISEACSVTEVTIRNTYAVYIAADPESSLSDDELESLTSLQVAREYHGEGGYEYIIHGTNSDGDDGESA